MNHKYQTEIFLWFGYDLSLKERLQFIQKASFDATFWWGDESAFHNEKKKIPQLVLDLGLHLEDIHVSYEKGNDFWRPSTAVQDNIVKIIWVGWKIVRDINTYNERNRFRYPNVIGVNAW